jgi:chromate reductase, NAD(P)H dehydrogenase (quinone)
MSSSPYRLLGVSGSLRTEAFSTAILETLSEAVVPKAITTIADIGSLPHYNQDLDGASAPDVVVDFKTQVMNADGLVIVSSEFNHGVPGILKNAIDWASRPGFRSPLKGKPILIITSSVAFTGGVRAQYQLREAFASTLSRVTLTPEVVIGAVHEKIVAGALADRAAIDYALVAYEALFNEIDLQKHAVKALVGAH